MSDLTEERTNERVETHACDLIDRQMAIDGFYEMASDMDYLCTVSDYVSFLESLPSAQPEIIRCRDCKLRDTEYCNMAHGFMGMKDDDYCSYAERRWR